MTSEKKLTLPTADEKAINELLKKLCDAWECSDGSAYALLFIDDAHFVAAPGFRIVGNKFIGSDHQEMFNSIFKFTRIDGNYEQEMQALTPDVVLIHSLGNVFFPGETEQNAKPTGLTTICVVKRNEEWKIASFQNTRTGKFGTLNFMWRFIFSRRYMLNATWKKEAKRIIEEKQRNIDTWKHT